MFVVVLDVPMFSVHPALAQASRMVNAALAVGVPTVGEPTTRIL